MKVYGCKTLIMEMDPIPERMVGNVSVSGMIIT